MDVTLRPSRVHRSAFRRAASRGARPVRQVCAWALVLLAALPFTAPFSTCNIAMLMGDSRSALHLARPLSMTTTIEARTDSSPGSMLDEESFKDVIGAPSAFDLFVASAMALAATPMPATSVAATPLVALRL